MSRPNDHPDANLDRFLSCNSSHNAFDTGGDGKPVGTVLRMEPRDHISPIRQPVPGNFARGPGISRSTAVELRAAGAGWSVDVPAAENDHESDIGSTATPDQPDDAVDDANHVRRIHLAIPGWPGHIHTVLKHCRRDNSILRRRKTTSRTVRTIVPGYRTKQGRTCCTNCGRSPRCL